MRVFILILAALVAACRPASAAEILAGPYAAEILRVIDGDTVEALVHVWLGLDVTTRVRLRGIDSPELHGACPDAAQAARDALISLLGHGPVTLSRIANDKYGGRVDASVALPSGMDVSAAMLAAGHARTWPRPKGEVNCPSASPTTSGVIRSGFAPVPMRGGEAAIRLFLLSEVGLPFYFFLRSVFTWMCGQTVVPPSVPK